MTETYEVAETQTDEEKELEKAAKKKLVREMQKKEEAKLNFGKDRVTRNFSFGYETQDNE